jgi:3-oxoacid CoA-transferase B subunit
MTTATASPQPTENLDRDPLDRDELAAIIARDIPAGSYVNLGIGQPTLMADHLRPEAGVVQHTENGMLGMGGAARGSDVDPDLINAGKIPVTEPPGASYFHHADSFAMMRGGHLDVCVLGAFEVSRHVPAHRFALRGHGLHGLRDLRHRPSRRRGASAGTFGIAVADLAARMAVELH